MIGRADKSGSDSGRHRSRRVVTLLAERVTHSPEETTAFGRELAAHLHRPCLVLLQGDLGSGKTTLVKGIVSGLNAAPEEDVTSPSFALIHEYGSGGRVYHADLYRIEGPRDLATLGLDELAGSQTTVLVEWGEKLGDNIPTPYVRIRMEHLGGNERHVHVERMTS